MNLLDIGEIVTPIDDPCQYDPAWRSHVANYLFLSGARTTDDLDSVARFGALSIVVEEEPAPEELPKGNRAGKKKQPKAKKQVKPRPSKKQVLRPLYPFSDSNVYRCLASDPWIRGLVGVLDAISRGLPSTKEDAGIRLAKRWYEEVESEASAKNRIEPLLLTGVGMDVITMDMMGIPSAQPVFEAYERLYFNCRDDDWNLNPSGMLIQRMAMPHGPLKSFLRKWEEVDSDGFVIGDGRPISKESDVWRAIAATMGYEALMYTWRWDKRAHGMSHDNSVENMIDMSWKVALSKLIPALYTGDIMHEDVARILAAYTAQAKKISDDRNGVSGNEEGDTTKALMAILSITSPKMVEFSEADEKAKNDEIQSRIMSQMSINKTAIDDKGAQINAEVMDAQISNAIST